MNLDEQVLGKITAEQISGLTPKAFKKFNEEQVQALDADSLTGLSTEQAGKINKKFAGFLDQQQIRALSVESLDAVSSKVLKEIEPSLSDTQLNELESLRAGTPELPPEPILTGPEPAPIDLGLPPTDPVLLVDPPLV